MPKPTPEKVPGQPDLNPDSLSDLQLQAWVGQLGHLAAHAPFPAHQEAASQKREIFQKALDQRDIVPPDTTALEERMKKNNAAWVSPKQNSTFSSRGSKGSGNRGQFKRRKT